MSPPEERLNRSYEVVLFGATGFTGGKTAEYLARAAPQDLRWAIAGRSREKLDAVKARLQRINAGCNPGVLVAQVDDPASLRAMAEQTRLVVTTVGPFSDYGEPVVAACIEARTDYVDSTGEPHFVNMLWARYGERARERGVRVVPSCGFDSIPADLGALFTVSQLPPNEAIELAAYVSFKGTFSGGTERSAIKAMAPPREPVEVPRPEPGEGRRVEIRPARVGPVRAFGGWSAPMPTVDAAIVERSAAGLERYGPNFRYAHHALHPSLAVFAIALVFFGTLALLAQLAPVRNLLLKVAKKSGEGPSPTQMAAGWFKVRFIAKCAGQELHTEVAGGDPGYGETSKMLAETALCLVRDRNKGSEPTGVLTAAQAGGGALIERLQRAGLEFRVLEK